MPPRPLFHGSTAASAKPVATAASTALPPLRSTSAPTSAAERYCATTMPRSETAAGFSMRQFWVRWSMAHPYPAARAMARDLLSDNRRLGGAVLACRCRRRDALREIGPDARQLRLETL